MKGVTIIHPNENVGTKNDEVINNGELLPKASKSEIKESSVLPAEGVQPLEETSESFQTSRIRASLISKKFEHIPEYHTEKKGLRISNRRLKTMNDEVKKERQKVRGYLYEAYEELIARRELAKYRLLLCGRRRKAAEERKVENARIRKERDPFYKREMEVKQYQIEATEKECKTLEANLKLSSSEMEFCRQRFTERMKRFDEFTKETMERMRKRNEELIALRKKEFDENEQLKEVESDIRFLEDILQYLRRRSEVFRQMKAYLDQAIQAKPPKRK